MYLVILCLSMTAWANSKIPEVGSAITEADWAVVEDPAQGIYDAVILENYIEFAPMAVNHYRRIRILSEGGKTAAQFVDESGKANNLKGRVITRSGEEITFDNQKDFVEVLDYKVKGKSSFNQVLLPPGLTSDCIVEYSWTYQTFEGLMEGEFRHSYPIQSSWFVKKSIFKLNNAAFKSRGSWSITRWGNYTPPPPARFTRDEKGTSTTLTYEDIPAKNKLPFSQDYFDPMAVSVIIYKTVPGWGHKPEDFWQSFAREYVRSLIYDNIRLGGREYKKWIADLKASLPEDKLQAAVFAYNAFKEKISPTDLLPPAKKAIMAERESLDGEDNGYLQEAFDRGYGEPYMLCELFFKVAKDLDLGLKLIYTNPKQSRQFEPAALDPYNLYLSYPFFGMPVNGGWFVFAPGWAEYPPGLFPSSFQSRPAIALDLNSWKAEFIRMPGFDNRYHQVIRQYTMTMNEDGSMSFSVNRKSSGEYNAFTLNELLPLPEDEQVNQIKKDWQDRLETWSIDAVRVLNADSSTKTVEYTVSGSTSGDLEGGSWTALNPFPGDWMPIRTPENWPKNRISPIFLDRPLTVIDLATVIIPQNWKLRGDSNWEKSNVFGKVSFKAVQEGNKVTVRRDIVLQRDFAGPESENDLKAYLAWMEEAMYQTLGLDFGVAQ